MNPKYRRLFITIIIVFTLGLATKLILMALEENIVYFYTPSEIEKEEIGNRSIRIGGLVKENSIIIEGLTTRFVIQDAKKYQAVIYTGALPDIFRDGQGVIVEGKFKKDTFEADVVMAKHDEKYMPREVADKLKEQGIWQGEVNK